MSEFENFSLEDIVNVIILRSLTDDLGILTGRMGAVIFLFHYDKYKEKDTYGDFAGLLIDDIFEDIHNQMPISFDKGLTGIGWGVEYILKNQFVEGDSFDILEAIDRYIMSRDIKRIDDESFATGLEGLFHYILYHLPTDNTKNSPFDKAYYNDLDIVAINKVRECKNKKLAILVEQYMAWRKGEQLHYNPNVLIKSILNFGINRKKLPKTDITLGLDKGYAGIGLQLLDIFRNI